MTPRRRTIAGTPKTGRPRRPKKNRLGLWTALFVGFLVAAYAAVVAFSQPHVGGDRLSLTSFVDMVQDGRIRGAQILDVDSFVVGTYVNDGQVEERYNVPYLKENRDRLVDVLIDSRVPTSVDQQNGKRAVSLASILLPGLIITVLFVYLIVSYRRGSGLFGVRSGARMVGSGDTAVTFADVAGQEAAVAELREVGDFLAEPERFAAIGAQVPKGVLLFGPPGCGKTLLARALAGESGASFFSISGSDFVEIYVGVGAARVRDLFRQAREHAPSLVFVDELDSIGRARGTVAGTASHGEQEHALNQLLAEMDGFSTSEGIMVIGATNRPDVLDTALLRPGRFDRSIGLERPDEAARLAILELHAKNKRVDPVVDLAPIARRAIGLTGADLANLVNEAALLAVRGRRATISQPELDEALQRLLEAPERQRRLAMRERSIGTRFVGAERVTFAEVAGVDDAIEELAEIRDYLANPQALVEIGARAPRGVLLAGPPGCGKTLLARAVAGEANAAFLSVAGSEFVEVFAGEGASRVRDLFAEAKAVAPSIIFIDELDAIGARRGLGVDGHREREQTLNQILIELDGFGTASGVMVMAATNRPDILDPALVRPGRFDRQVAVALPDRAGRRAILALHATTKSLGPDVDLDAVAATTRGFSGADLANVLNEAALLAARRGRDTIGMAILEEAVDRANLGTGSRGVVMSEDERRVVAYHEAGHVVVARALPGASVPHRVTIVARGDALGHCTMLDPHDTVLQSRSALMELVAALLGGRAAEELVFGEPVSGAANDLARATSVARRMVCELGMSDAVGPAAYTANGSDGGRPLSEEVTRAIDAEVRRLVEEGHTRAARLLEGDRAALERIAAALLERETLSGEDLERLVRPPALETPARR